MIKFCWLELFKKSWRESWFCGLMPTLQSFVKQRSCCTGIQTIQDLVKEASNTSNFREKNRIKVVPKKAFQEWTAQQFSTLFSKPWSENTSNTFKYHTICRGEMQHSSVKFFFSPALFVSQPARHIEEFAHASLQNTACSNFFAHF